MVPSALSPSKCLHKLTTEKFLERVVAPGETGTRYSLCVFDSERDRTLVQDRRGGLSGGSRDVRRKEEKGEEQVRVGGSEVLRPN